MRWLDAALGLCGRDSTAQDSVWSAWCEGGVKPPHSKALRAFSCFLGAHQPTGMNDPFDIDSRPQREQGPGVVGGGAATEPPLTLP